MSSAIKRCRSGKREGPDLKPLTENAGKVYLNISKKANSTYFSSTRFLNILQLDSWTVFQ